jgi:hypothetical protein
LSIVLAPGGIVRRLSGRCPSIVKGVASQQSLSLLHFLSRSCLRSFLPATQKIAVRPSASFGNFLRDIFCDTKLHFASVLLSPLFSSFDIVEFNENFTAFFGHFSAQLKQSTHREKSTLLFFASIH